MGLIALLVLFGLLGSHRIPLPRPVGFRLFVCLLLSFNVLWWSIADRRVARYVASPRLARVLRLAIALFTIVLNVPVLWALYTGHVPSLVSNPTWYTMAATLWQVSLPLLMPAVAAMRLAGLGILAFGRRLFALSSTGVRDESDTIDPGRRAVLRTAFASVPVALLAGGTAFGDWQSGHVRVRRHKVPAPWLPDRLRGLTITQISDLHVGRLFRPESLPHVIDEANKLKSDIVVVTGDIVDSSNQMLPTSIEALRQLTHRHGIFLCMGNHDEFDDRDEFIRYTSQHLPLLINKRRSLVIGGERLTIAGVDYADDSRPSRRRPGDVANVSHTLKGYDSALEGPAIALAHHPHTWDDLRRHKIPLTLSGHTHGGQLMLTPPGWPELGLGNVLFRYIRGFYGDGASTLFVNTGVGNWFPVRINAPAEIVQLQLV
jgi:predicted MPP superfamily phosphohydrolase